MHKTGQAEELPNKSAITTRIATNHIGLTWLKLAVNDQEHSSQKNGALEGPKNQQIDKLNLEFAPVHHATKFKPVTKITISVLSITVI